MSKKSPFNEAVFADKQSFFQSGTTVQRFREPTNVKVAKNMTQYVFDHSTQAKATPNGAIVQASAHEQGLRSTNRSGKSAVFGPMTSVFVGGSDDHPGRFKE